MTKKIILAFSIVFIFIATFAMGFYLFKRSEVKVFQTEWFAQKRKVDKKEIKISEPKEKVKILFTGDMMFDRWIRQVSQNRGFDFIFSESKNLLESQDLVIGNLEGPLTDNQSVSLGSAFGSWDNYVFIFSCLNS